MWPPETTSAANVSGTGAEGPPAAVQERRERVPLDVVHGNEGHREPEREALSFREADEQGADEPGTGRRRDRRDVGQARAGVGERRVEKEGQVLKMRACRDLGHDAAEAAMGLLLRRHAGGARPARAVEKRDGGLVAGRLEAEDERLVRLHRERSRWSASACGGAETPRSVTIASTRAAGVTSKAG